MTKTKLEGIPLTKTAYPKRPDLIDQLVAFDYIRVNLVMEPGEFSVRGGVIDIFSFGHSHPVRLDYFGDQLERFNSFDPATQRSLSELTETTLYSSESATGSYSHSDFIEADQDLLIQLNEGDYVVHELHGVGLYQGLVHLNLRGQEGEYVHIAYKDKDKLYMPLDQLHLLHKFSEGEGTPKLNKLYDGSWKRTTERTRRALDELVHDIYALVKKRQETPGFACAEDSEAQLIFESTFQHTETPDQLKAVEVIKKDMESPTPMDRLLCGDVGFGKTEVLIRAAFKATDNLKQVAVLVPTTILAEQHYKVFEERFKGHSCRIRTLSGFKTKAQQKQVLADLKSQRCDIVIGTHRLLQKDVVFADLGLLVVDEEQRFGVTHKEKIKRLCDTVDCLSVSATPIPRTMYMSLTGSRSISLMATAPKGRQAIHTVVNQYSDEILATAIQAELDRQGQVYYVYNDIDRFSEKVDTLKKLFPNLKMTTLHGRMKPADIEARLMTFYQGDYDLLLSTTIVENGLDIPNVNTIIMDKAENFGLSQIHQIRGRVGRSSRQGFAYVLFSDFQKLSDKATQRFRAIQAYVTLGAGYHLAMKDLEIRGAGTLLGEKQSGHVTAVGFELYCKLLEDAVQKQQGGVQSHKPLRRIASHLTLYIPDTYIENPKERLAIYKRILNFDIKTEVDFLIEELEDRYGQCPKSLGFLFEGLKASLTAY